MIGRDVAFLQYARDFLWLLQKVQWNVLDMVRQASRNEWRPSREAVDLFPPLWVLGKDAVHVITGYALRDEERVSDHRNPVEVL